MISVALLLPLYFASIQYERGGLWRLCAVFVVVGLALDVILNYTELTIFTLDFPKRGEWTFSKRLARLQYNDGWRGEFARYVAGCLNAIAPSGRHIYEGSR
jgi:hypothetical protein